MAYPMTKYRGFRVISPLTVPKSEERLAPEGNGHSGTSTPVDYPDGGKVRVRGICTDWIMCDECV